MPAPHLMVERSNTSGCSSATRSWCGSTWARLHELAGRHQPVLLGWSARRWSTTPTGAIGAPSPSGSPPVSATGLTKRRSTQATIRSRTISPRYRWGGACQPRISRWSSARQIISRSRSASGAFSISARRLIISSASMISRLGWCQHFNPTGHRRWPPRSHQSLASLLWPDSWAASLPPSYTITKDTTTQPSASKNGLFLRAWA